MTAFLVLSTHRVSVDNRIKPNNSSLSSGPHLDTHSKASRKHDSVIERIYFFSLPIQGRNIRSIVKYTAEDDTTNRLKKRMN